MSWRDRRAVRRRMRMARKLWLWRLGLALLVVPAPAAPQAGVPVVEDTVHTVIDLGVAQLLDLIQRQVPDREHPLCLRGRVTRDSTVIQDASAATVSESRFAGAEFSCQDQDDIIGFGHNHPPGTLECGISLEDLGAFQLSDQIRVIAHTCVHEGRTAIIVRRRDRFVPAVVLFTPEDRSEDP